MSVPSLVLVDLCGTLVRTDTTRGFAAELAGPRAARWARLGAAVAARLPATLDVGRRAAIASLAGAERRRLYERAGDYAQRALAENARRPIVQAVNALARRGAAVILVTATVDPVASGFRLALGYRGVISSELLYIGSRCAGFLRVDVLGRKWEHVRRRFGGAIGGTYFLFTDNPTDLDLMERASKTFFVGTPPASVSERVEGSRIESVPI